MAEFKIFCNNTADLSEEKVKEFDLNVMELVINIADKSYRHIPVDTFYQALRAGALPTTSAANIGEGIEAFEPALQAGYDVLCLAFSSALSTTYNALCMAAEELGEKYPDRKLYVIDTVAASSGEAILVLKAAEMRQEGASIQAVRDWVEENKRNVVHWFSVDDLNHLKRGGRVSATTAAVGGVLQIKPILHVDNDGRLVKADKVRGRTKSLAYLAEKVEKTIVNPEAQVVYIPHGDCEEEANWLKDQILSKVKVKDVVVQHLGPVIAAHTGVGLVAVIYMGAER
ncbi:MAG: DegV family protein [Oscillospiraceae bacterium]|nr:DegV family protein [Oscillospiraceae bacterium]